MALLKKEDREFLQEHLAKALLTPVKLLYFTQEMACQFCRETKDVLREVADLSDKVTLKVFSFIVDENIAEQYGIEKIPATVVMTGIDYGVRFYGIPSGYEFTSLIEAIVDVSQGRTDLEEETIEVIKGITDPVHMQVFVTPTCPYCTRAVRLAHSLAVASKQISADMVESIEFPQLANRYQVQGVPRTIINEETHLEGAVPEAVFVAAVLESVGMIAAQDVEELMEDLDADAGIT